MACVGVFFLCFRAHRCHPGSRTWCRTRGGCTDRDQGRLFARTGLLFGRARPDGSVVTDEEFRAFLDHINHAAISQRIDGAVRDRTISRLQRQAEREGAVFVILLYPAGDKDSSVRIEEIRGSYRRIFVQESVLRVDGESCVEFRATQNSTQHRRGHWRLCFPRAAYKASRNR